MPAAPLSPAFDRMVTPARQRPGLWRLIPGLALLIAIYLGLNALAWFGWAALAGTDRAELLAAKLVVASTPASALLLLATFVPLALGTAAAARWVHRRSVASLFGPRRAFIRDAGRAILVASAVYAAALGLWHLSHDSAPNLPFGIWAALLPVTLLAVGLQTLAEEMVFRGYLQVQLAARFARPLIWGGLPALVFGLLHFDPSRMGDSAIFVVAAAAGFGLVAADLTARTGNLGAAWGLHFVNNMAALAILATSGTITGLGLRVTPYAATELTRTPWLAMAELLPLLICWFLLRRILPR